MVLRDSHVFNARIARKDPGNRDAQRFLSVSVRLTERIAQECSGAILEMDWARPENTSGVVLLVDDSGAQPDEKDMVHARLNRNGPMEKATVFQMEI